MERPYQRISCSLYDSLEAWAVRRQVLHIQLRAIEADEGPRDAQTITARIVDLNTRKGIEYMLLDNGEEFRLDDIDTIQPID